MYTTITQQQLNKIKDAKTDELAWEAYKEATKKINNELDLDMNNNGLDKASKRYMFRTVKKIKQVALEEYWNWKGTNNE